MFKKVMSVALAAAMVASVGAVAVNAAEVEDVAVAAEDSSAVGAENSSEVGADSSSEATGAASTIYFDAESSGWANYKTIYCHIWRADGEGEWPQWQTRKERCTKEEDGRYSYDLTKTGNEIKSSDGNLYCVIFSADTGVQTYNTIMSGSCIGDTCYVTGETVENPEDSEKTAQVAAWKNNPSCGPQRVITSTAKVVGTALAEGTTDVTLLADYLIKYAADAGKLEKTQSLLDSLKISPLDVMASVKFKEEEAVKSGSKAQADVAKAIEREEVAPSIEQSAKIRRFAESGILSAKAIDRIMREQKPEKRKVTLKEDMLNQYFPEDFTVKQIEETLVKLLENWSRKRHEPER